MALDWTNFADEKNYRRVSFQMKARDTGQKKNDVVKGELLLQKSPFDHKALIVLIPGMGENVSTKGSAEVLANAGFDVVRFRSGISIFEKRLLENKTNLSPEEFRAFVARGSKIIRNRACDYVMMIRYLDNRFGYEYVGVSGVSLGGIFAALIAAEEQKIQDVLMMISGGNIAEVLRTSTERPIAEIRDLVEKKFTGSNEDLWKILKEELAIAEPLARADSLCGKRVRIIANHWDSVIRPRYSREFRSASCADDYEVILFPPGHYGSGLLLWIPMLRLELFNGFLPYPRSFDTVSDINLRFFQKTLH